MTRSNREYVKSRLGVSDLQADLLFYLSIPCYVRYRAKHRSNGELKSHYEDILNMVFLEGFSLKRASENCPVGAPRVRQIVACYFSYLRDYFFTERVL